MSIDVASSAARTTRSRSVWVTPVRCLMCVAAGVLTTVATAWAIASQRSNSSGGLPISAILSSNIRGHSEWTYFTVESFGSTAVLLCPPDGGGSPPLVSRFDLDAAPDVPRWANPPTPSALGSVAEILELGYGWPCRAMRGATITPRTGSAFEAHDMWSPNPYGTRSYPLGIIPLGVVVNSTIFAVLWGVVLFAAIRAIKYVRNRIRISRHPASCPVCGYNRADDRAARCPECGSAERPCVTSVNAARRVPR